MFTGIIEEICTLKGLYRKEGAHRLKILTKTNLEGVKNGDSLSLNGVCLTVVEKKDNHISFDIMNETFLSTSFKYAKLDDKINLEKSLVWKSRVDGHFVLGHVDSVQKIIKIEKKNRPNIDISIDRKDKRFIVKKGSIAVDGVSLTVGEVFEGRIRLFIIPYTLTNTSLLWKKTGDRVNLEFDILGKYAMNSMDTVEKRSRGIAEKTLKDGGFI